MIIRPFLVAAIVVGCAGTPTTSASQNISICDLRDEPDRYVGKSVTLTGVYQTDRRHFSFVYSEGCDGLILSPYLGADGSQSRLNDSFQKAVAGELADLSLRIFRVELRGIPGPLVSENNRRFDVTEVLSFERLAE